MNISNKRNRNVTIATGPKPGGDYKHQELLWLLAAMAKSAIRADDSVTYVLPK